MKFTRPVLTFVLVVAVSAAAALMHLTDATFDLPTLRVHG